VKQQSAGRQTEICYVFFLTGSKLTDVFVAVHLGKEKFQTSTIKNALNPEWFEQCDL
jgi:hypothetical protein